MKKSKEDQQILPISMKMLEALANFQEIELEDVDIDFEELEISLSPSMGGMPSITLMTRIAREFGIIRAATDRVSEIFGHPTLMRDLVEIPPGLVKPQIPYTEVPTREKPTSLIYADVEIPSNKYPGSIVEVKLGATKTEGGTRGSSVIIGGETVPAYYNFLQSPPHKPVIAFDVFDWAKIPLAKAVKNHFREVVDDTPEWAKLCVEKFGAEMINLHFLSIDPLIEDTSPKAAVKKTEDVLQAVDVPLAIGGCGDPKKDLEVFKAIAEATEGERILFNSVTLDMDIETTAKFVNDNGHTVIAFTSMDVNRARELNRKLYDFLPKDRIVMDTTTAALGYGLDYAFTVMERTRLAGLKGDPELNHPLSSGSTNAWAAREAWMKMGPKWAPRELRGPIWETITAQTLLLTGVDYFMMMHPAAVVELRKIIDNLMSGKKPSETIDWVSMKI